METFEFNGCSLYGRNYSHDAHVCTEEKCVICNNGDWVDASELFPPKQSGLHSP